MKPIKFFNGISVSPLTDVMCLITYEMFHQQLFNGVFFFVAGEDRWLCTLLLERGYRVEYCAAADCLTHAPKSFTEFFKVFFSEKMMIEKFPPNQFPSSIFWRRMNSHSGSEKQRINMCLFPFSSNVGVGFHLLWPILWKS